VNKLALALLFGALGIGAVQAAAASPASYLSPLLAELEKDWPANRTVNIVFHGHSVPAGYFKTPEVRSLEAYPHLVRAELARRFPHAVINVIVTAKGGEDSVSGAARFEQDVLAKNPDVVLIDYSLNDRRPGLYAAAEAWTKMIRAATEKGIKVILLTPTPDLRAKLGQAADPLEQQAAQVRRLASQFETGLVDSLAIFEKTKDPAHMSDLMSQGNHPNAEGHRLVADAILQYFEKPAAGATGPRRPSPEAIQAWQDRKFGLFIHWGLYSILGGVWQGKPVTYGYSEQIQTHAPVPKQEYEALAKQFNPSRFDPDAIADLAVAAGMKYVVLTSKHHDGFNMFGTKLSKYNVVDATPYGKDVVRQLEEACRRRGLSFGVYYSSIDWNFPGSSPPDVRDNNNVIPPAHEEFNVGQLRELLANYGPLSEIWFDMGKVTPAQSKRFTDTVHGLQPDCMVSGRVFNNQGDFTVMGDNNIPKFVIDEPWQTPASIYHQTWGYRSWQKRDDLDGKIREHITKLVEVVSRGGNYLLNIGPKGDGEVPEFEVNVLRGIGKWVHQNGEAIYAAKPQPFRQLDFGYATVKPNRLYLFVRDWPADGKLRLPGLRTKLTRASFLGDAAKSSLTIGPDFIGVQRRLETPPLTVIEAEYDGPLQVTPPLIQPSDSGAVTLLDKDADHFMNYNGYGYYDPPTVYKQKWSFRVQRPGRYAIELDPKPAQYNINVDGRDLGAVQAVDLDAAEYHTVAITPPVPFAKGDKLSPPVGSVSIAPVQ
jgi:alpha-L-fucosidase